MKQYNYKGFTFYQTQVSTTVNVPKPGMGYYQAIRNLYEIDDLKPHAMRPFLTSIRECREYIDGHSTNNASGEMI